MAPLINFPIDLGRTASALEKAVKELSRIADCLERIAPALADSQTAPYQAGLSDLRRTNEDSLQAVRDELSTFAQNANVVLDSDAFFQSIVTYEKQIAEAYGPEAILELPWNKAAGGPLFERHHRQGDADQPDRKNSAKAQTNGQT
jgi:exonuclease VII small subunit